jgi:hypothetical protein
MADRFPSIVTDATGLTLATWADDDPEDEANATLHLARRAPGGPLEALEVTPFEGAFQRPWVCAGTGIAAIAFYGTQDVVPNEASQWHVYAILTADAGAPTPEWTLLRLDEMPVSERAVSPGDFFQCAVAQDGAVHVTYLRESEDPLPVGANYAGTILHVRQATGPNLHP